MKEALRYLDTVKIHVHNFDCNINGGSDSPATSNQVVPKCPKPTLSADHESTEY